MNKITPFGCNFFYFIQTNYMIIINFLVLILVGLVNGCFSSSAGQILVFYYIYILKISSKEARNYSLCIIPIISIPTLIYYAIKVKINLKVSIILILISIIFGSMGNKIMRKIKSNSLNLISGIILVLFSIINLWRMK